MAKPLTITLPRRNIELLRFDKEALEKNAEEMREEKEKKKERMKKRRNVERNTKGNMHA